MRLGIVVLGLLFLVFGFVEYASITTFFIDVDLGIAHDTLALAVIVVGIIISIVGGILPTNRAVSGEVINPNDMKSCFECSALMEPTAFRCPKCGARARSLYEEIK